PGDVWATAESHQMRHLGPDTAHRWADVAALRAPAAQRRTARRAPADGGSVVAGLAEAARSAGRFWPMREVVVFTERPIALHRDTRGRLHRDDGPAAAWPDGFAVWAWHGTPVARHVIEDPASVTDEEIDDEPREQVRALLVERRDRAAAPPPPG
ncbi:MAG TPA: hypothetical protein VD813_08610, partial [Pseudonocardia sp.]|nr:hypothetical protein [Pseudonocardia sp.]